MALSLGVVIGDLIKIGEVMVKVRNIEQDNVIVLSMGSGKTVYVSDKERVEILPDVFVQAGLPEKQWERHSRLAIDAPRSIRIERVR